jgi:protein-S-isoprenylcysteine O-methyltransferase Ste14
MFISGAHLRALPFSARLRVGPLAWRFVPDSPVVAWAGLAVTAAGFTFAIWARMLLGGNWSSSMTVKQDHQLIRQGPYSIVRHPIYSGLLLALLAPRWRWVNCAESLRWRWPSPDGTSSPAERRPSWSRNSAPNI